MLVFIKPLLCSILVIFACLGLGRFGYGMVLPDLQNSLHLSYTQAGFIGTTNFIGYLLGILFVGLLYKKYETNLLIQVSLILQAFGMICMTFFSNYLWISFFYGFSGFFTAICNISIMVYIAHIIPERIKGKALGIIVTGNGFAIIFAGFLVPYIDSSFLASSWKINWIIFAVLTLLIAFYSKYGLRQHDIKQQTEQNELPLKLLKSLKFYKIAFLYLIFGITYVVYVTFFVIASIEKYDISSFQSGYFWSILGFMSLFSGPVFGNLADKIGAYKTLIIIFCFQTIANAILALNLSSNFLFISAVLFGVTAWAIPPLITLLSSQEFGVKNTVKVFSLATLIFAFGQVLGPIGAGYIYDIKNDFSNVFLICALLTLTGTIFSSVFSLKQKKV